MNTSTSSCTTSAGVTLRRSSFSPKLAAEASGGGGEEVRAAARHAHGGHQRREVGAGQNPPRASGPGRVSRAPRQDTRPNHGGVPAAMREGHARHFVSLAETAKPELLRAEAPA